LKLERKYFPSFYIPVFGSYYPGPGLSFATFLVGNLLDLGGWKCKAPEFLNLELKYDPS